MPPPIQAPTSLVYPQASISAIVGTAISTDTPTVTGTVTGYTVSPALPAGLSLNSTTGAISGTPTALSPQTSYTVTASNSSGSTSNAVSIAVLIPAPSKLAYAQTSISAIVGAPIATDTPTVTGIVTGYAISPALPAGIKIDSSTGVISGTPTAASPQSAYTVTASNSTGSGIASISMTVVGPKAILELGHSAGITDIRATTDRVLTLDSSGHWNLWDYGTGQIVANGDGGIGIDLAGSLVMIETATTLDVYSAVTGKQIFILPRDGWFKLATDGSYLVANSASGFTVWSPSGAQVFTRPGSYNYANVFAAPGQVQVALGPAGVNVIETVSVPSGSSTVSKTFSPGTFKEWFLDGKRFITSLGNASVWVYNNDAVQQAAMNLPSSDGLIGQGDWIWTGPINSVTVTDPLQIYALGNSTPVATYTVGGLKYVTPTGSFIAFPDSVTNGATLVDLSGAIPSATDHPLPAAMSSQTAFAAYSGSQWIVGNESGALLDGASASAAPRYFGYGSVLSIAGSPNNIAIATSIGEILLFDPTGATQQGTIDFPAGKLQLSSDGSVLAASNGQSLNLYSLPSRAIVNTFAAPLDFSLSASGQTLGQVLGGAVVSRQVTPLSGSPVIWSDSGIDGPLLLSPDGTRFAAANEYPLAGKVPPSVTLWNGDSQESTFSALPEGWVDNTHLLAETYSVLLPYGLLSTSNGIYDSTWNLVSPVPLPPIATPFFIPNGLVYDPDSNGVYSLSTGAAVWTGPGAGSGAIQTTPTFPDALSGSNIVYLSGHQIFFTPY